MARFQFRLAAVLRLRELARDERRTQLAEALRLVDQLRSRCDEIEDQLRGAQQALTPSPGAVDVDRLLNATRYELVLRAEQRQLQQQEAALAGELEKRRQALIAADRDVRSLERLRETQQQRHLEEEDQRARKDLDEVALRRFAAERDE